MGVYLNSKSPFGLFFDEAASTYYVDKSSMILDLLPLVEDSRDVFEKGNTAAGKSNKYICVTRPRRFGKTVMACMIAESEEEARFIFVLDEWDYIFHREYVTENDKKAYLEFLSNLLKGKAYVELVYMTGILPIAKYSSGSELNMFYEYTMAEEERYSEYFGFTDEEVDDLFRRYERQNPESHNVTREGLRVWYDGYYTKSGERMYNPRSVVAALTNNNPGNYWTSSGPYDEISYYIQKNTSLGYVYRLAAASSRMLQATIQGDTKVMSEILEYAHNTESPLIYYNNETE